MSAGGRPEPQRRFGVGDHSPIFSCNDCDGGLFDLYSDVTGRPTVMIFACQYSLPKFAEVLAANPVLNSDAAQVVTFLPGSAEEARTAKDALCWPHQTVADVGSEIANGFAQLSGIQPPAAYVLDCNQRVVGMIGFKDIGANLPLWLKDRVSAASHLTTADIVSGIAPVLIVPRVLDPQDCNWLINRWHTNDKVQGQVALGETATARDGVVRSFKRREDYIVNDAETEQKIINLVMPRMAPEISKIYHFENWRIEAFRVGCYKAEDEGFFHVHRDDSNPSVKHRKFAVTINLNSDEYEGGDLRFPEYGNQLYRPPAGGAIVFSCSMLHEVVPVTAGERYVLLTFLTE